MDWAKFDELSEKYQETFGECLPTELIPQKDLKKAIEIMEQCLKTGKPYELPADTEQLLEQGAVF